MNKILKYVIIISVFASLCGTYFYRDFVFINANSQIKYLDEIEALKLYAQDNSDYQFNAEHVRNWTHSKMELKFTNWSRADLISYKWKMTFVFTILFSGISALGLGLLKLSKLLIFCLMFYAVLFGLAFFVNYLNYSISRDIIGLLHSPLPFLMFVAISYMNKLIPQHEE